MQPSWTRDGTCVPCIGRRILNCQTTRKAGRPNLECCYYLYLASTVSLWTANYQGGRVLRILKSPSFISNMHSDPCLWWKTRSAKVQANPIIIFFLPTARLIAIQIWRNQGYGATVSYKQINPHVVQGSTVLAKEKHSLRRKMASDHSLPLSGPSLCGNDGR